MVLAAGAGAKAAADAMRREATKSFIFIICCSIVNYERSCIGGRRLEEEDRWKYNAEI